MLMFVHLFGVLDCIDAFEKSILFYKCLFRKEREETTFLLRSCVFNVFFIPISCLWLIYIFATIKTNKIIVIASLVYIEKTHVGFRKCRCFLKIMHSSLKKII